MSSYVKSGMRGGESESHYETFLSSSVVIVEHP